MGSQQRVDEQSAVDYVDKVVAWREEELVRMFPELPIEQVEELAHNTDRELLAKAARLKLDGCPASLAYRILR